MQETQKIRIPYSLSFLIWDSLAAFVFVVFFASLVFFFLPEPVNYVFGSLLTLGFILIFSIMIAVEKLFFGVIVEADNDKVYIYHKTLASLKGQVKPNSFLLYENRKTKKAVCVFDKSNLVNILTLEDQLKLNELKKKYNRTRIHMKLFGIWMNLKSLFAASPFKIDETIFITSWNNIVEIKLKEILPTTIFSLMSKNFNEQNIEKNFSIYLSVDDLNELKRVIRT